jgi:hypothetical protein
MHLVTFATCWHAQREEYPSASRCDSEVLVLHVQEPEDERVTVRFLWCKKIASLGVDGLSGHRCRAVWQREPRLAIGSRTQSSSVSGCSSAASISICSTEAVELQRLRRIAQMVVGHGRRFCDATQRVLSHRQALFWAQQQPDSLLVVQCIDLRINGRRIEIDRCGAFRRERQVQF